MRLTGFSVVMAHGVFSTTVSQLNTEDKFRDRMYSVEFGFSVAMRSNTAGMLIDRGISAFGLAAVTGPVMLIPAVAWLWALRLWRQ